MIDPDWPKPIAFQKEDVPELPEIAQTMIDAKREEQRRKREENALWFEEYFGWKPFGGEW